MLTQGAAHAAMQTPVAPKVCNQTGAGDTGPRPPAKTASRLPTQPVGVREFKGWAGV